MITLEINHEPVSWKAHGGYGRRSFNRTEKEKQFYQWQIRTQYNRLEPIKGPVRVGFTFHMPIPKATSKVRRTQMLNGIIHHISRPGIPELQDFLLECCQEILFISKNQVCDFQSKKIYSETPKTLINVHEITY